MSYSPESDRSAKSRMDTPEPRVLADEALRFLDDGRVQIILLPQPGERPLEAVLQENFVDADTASRDEGQSGISA